LNKPLLCRDLIEPDDTGLWKSHVSSIEEPLRSLFDLGFAFYMIDERKDLLLPRSGSCIDDWRVRYFMLVPRHGCFRLTTSEPTHRFDGSCGAAGEAVFNMVKRENTGFFVFTNGLYAVTQSGGESRVNWCDTCFPRLACGARISFEYIQRVTGLNHAQLDAVLEAVTGKPFLQGLA
jgi:hypothetical protein